MSTMWYSKKKSCWCLNFTQEVSETLPHACSKFKFQPSTGRSKTILNLMLCRCHCRGGVISLYQITIVNKENKKLHEKKCQTASAFIHKSFIHTFSAYFKGQFRNDGYFLATGVKLSCIKLKRKSYTRWLVWLVKTQPVDFIKFLHPKTLKSYFIAGK